jgi:hypothetical protein
LPKDDTTPPVTKTKRVMGSALSAKTRTETIPAIGEPGQVSPSGREAQSATGALGSAGVVGAAGSAAGAAG